MLVLMQMLPGPFAVLRVHCKGAPLRSMVRKAWAVATAVERHLQVTHLSRRQLLRLAQPGRVFVVVLASIRCMHAPVW
jgi:hypothetical protein